MLPFRADFTADYYSLDSDLTISFHRFMTHVQETSLIHSKASGYPVQRWIENQKGWIITNWDVEFYRYPEWGESFYITTYPTMFKGVIAERAFNAYDSNNVQILSANSRWFFYNLEKRKPEKVPAYMVQEYGGTLSPSRETDFQISKIDGETLEPLFVKISKCDVDSNGHANNIRYMEWIDNAIQEKRKPTKMKIVYRKECVFGETVSVECVKAQSTIYTQIKKNDIVAAEAILYF